MSFNVQEIAQLLKQAKENKKPYVFFTGAGCSMSADIPSATGLIKEIRENFPIQIKNIDEEKDKYNYGKYMSALDKDERRRLLKPHIIDNKNINWAHIALACLIQAEYIQRVLTFNFDSILSRACNMLGLHPSIYDFATANPHLYHLINDPSIVHLHGQGTGFIQLNTEDETKKHTEKLSDFIAATLNSNPSLFIGYSGNADEFFPLLKEKYSEQHRLIWAGTKASIEEIEAESVKEFLTDNQNITHYIGNIDADDFLIQLAKELNCFPPELFSNPYAFLNNQLSVIQPYPLGDGLDILENLSTYLNEQAKKPLSKNLYTAVIHKYPNRLSTKGFSEKAINDIMWAYDQQAQYLIKQHKHDEGFKIYDQALSILDRHFGCTFNYALNLSNYADSIKDELIYNKSFHLYEKALRLQPKNVINLTSYANTTQKLALIKKDENLFHKAFELYKTALEFEKNDYIHGNYGVALSNLAEIKNDENLLNQSFEQFEMALKIMPNDVDYLSNIAKNFLYLARVKQDSIFFDKALQYINKTLEIRPNDTYDLACYYSIKKEIDLCKENLLHVEQHHNLPPIEHLSQDQDLNNIRKEQWFIELLERLKSKDENLDKVC